MTPAGLEINSAAQHESLPVCIANKARAIGGREKWQKKWPAHNPQSWGKYEVHSGIQSDKTNDMVMWSCRPAYISRPIFEEESIQEKAQFGFSLQFSSIVF